MPTPTILLVDAHEDSRLIYAAALGHYGFRVMQAECSANALELARAHPPHLIVLAVTLSSAPAWALLGALRQSPETAAIPVVALSTTGLSEHRTRALELGCAAFLVKPLPPLELLAAARQVLGAA
ncbi:MAG TPA: response regulator [Longimicrobium sp.]|nr:response regulator [Longimicrobium sp.]